MAEELKTTKTTKTAPKTTTTKKATEKVEKVEVKETVATEVKVAKTKKETKSVKQIKVTLVRSVIGYNKKQAKVLESLGLNKLNSSNVLPDNCAVRGMIFKVKHLVNVEEI